jgi:hypothetical protein
MSGQTFGNNPPLNLQLRHPAVDFVENRMQQYHPAYDMHGFSYNPNQGLFLPTGPRSMTSSPSSLNAANTTTSPVPRPAPVVVNDMKFWDEVFPKAMQKLNRTQTIKPGHPSQWGIRRCSSWPDVQAKIEMARRDYDNFHGSQHVGKFRRKLRDVLDKSTVPLQQVVKGVPSADMSSPIVSVANILLDVCAVMAQLKN